MAKDPDQIAHLEWLGYVQPVGLVVSIPALLQAQARVQRNISAEHQRFLSVLPSNELDEPLPQILDFPKFAEVVLEWPADLLFGAPGGPPLPDSLEALLPGYNEVLRPTYALKEQNPADPDRPWMLLIQSLPLGTPLDELSTSGESHWQATPHAKFERLLRETQVPAGLLFNGTQLRLVYAPRGETSGYLTFNVADMVKVAGRPIFAALYILLEYERLFSLPEKERLPAILADSRKYQNVVSTQLAQQVLAALYELVRGLQAADEQRKGELLREVLAQDPNHVYAGLLTVLLRLVFILYAEDRNLVSNNPVYTNYYSITGLFDRLRADAGRFPDTMDQRYGAWAQLLTLFRLIFDGGQHGTLSIPARSGYLFDPDRYNFLEGRAWKTQHTENEKLNVPRIADGVIYRVLEKLLILDGERLSYRTLDVEQIGSVYETMMGFNLQVATGRSIAIKPAKPHGAPSAINLDELLATKPADRMKWLADKSDQKLSGQMGEGVKSATSVDALLAALEKKIAHHATPNVVPTGAMVLQPSDERRKSGSHYTPRSLTEPIVRTTLKPILEALRLGDGSREIGSGEGKQNAPSSLPPSSPSSQIPAPNSLPPTPTPQLLAPNSLPPSSPNSLPPSSSSNVQPNTLLPGSPSLAIGNGSGTGELPGDEGLSARGNVRDDQPDQKGSVLYSRKHRGGARPGDSEGVSSVPPYSSGKSAGTGDASASRGEGESLSSTSNPTTASADGATGPNAAGAAKVTSEERGVGEGQGDGSREGKQNAPTPQLLAPNSLPSPPTPQLPAPNSLPSSPSPDQILALKVCDPAMGSGAFLVEACRQLGDALVDAWHAHQCVPQLPPDEDEILHARRLIAQRCLYGVDRNPMAVDLAKLSLWLATLAKDHPFTFLDHLLRAGDSLVGLSREQITAFHWEPQDQKDFVSKSILPKLKRATESRRKILQARDDVPYRKLQQELTLAEEALSGVRLMGDAAIAAFFAADKPKAREEARKDLASKLELYLGDMTKVQFRAPVDAAVKDLRDGAQPIMPFHWQIEFPEVFTVDAKGKVIGGFDAIVGNPPFVGGTSISSANGTRYKEYLYALYSNSGDRMDLVAYFFRRSFFLMRKHGTLGLIATNTIRQGDTRTGGLTEICRMGGVIYSAHRRQKWPGVASVIVSVVHISKQDVAMAKMLDGRPVNRISAYLFHDGGDSDPEKLSHASNLTFEGVKPYGQGFIFDDNDPKSSPRSVMDDITRRNPECRDVIFPYVSGEEVNDSSYFDAKRFIINFADRSLEACVNWSALLRLVEEKVKPERLTKPAEVSSRPWWQFFRSRAELFKVIASFNRVLAVSRVGDRLSFTFLPASVVPSEALVVITFQSMSGFASLQSRVHEIWARFFGSSMKDDLRYTPTDCFETFPFPAGVLEQAKQEKPDLTAAPHLAALESAGKEYYEFRADLMVRHDEGLTKTYNRFHDRDHDLTETDPQKVASIQRLRQLHAAMDQAVLKAYGWDDLAATATCEFLLDYEEEEEEDAEGATSSRRAKKKPWRYRWPDDFRDEVLARLLALNAERAEQEKLAGAGTEKKPAKRGAKGKKQGGQGELF